MRDKWLIRPKLIQVSIAKKEEASRAISTSPGWDTSPTLVNTINCNKATFDELMP